MNPFFNNQEYRPRAGIRIPLYIFFFFLFLGLASSIPLFGFEYLITAGVSLGGFWIFFRFVDNRSDMEQAGITINERWLKEFGIGSGIGITAMSLIFLTEWLMGDLEIIGYGWQNISHDFWMVPVLTFLLQMLCVGFYEELMARSYLITNVKEGFTFGKINPEKATIIAILLSSSIFGLGHAFNPNATLFAVLNILFAGVMLAIPYVLTGRLSYSVGLHFAWNFFQGGIFGFRVSGIPIRNSVIDIQQGGNAVWTGGSFGPEGGLIGLLSIVLISLFFLYYFKKKEGKIELHPVFKNTYKQNKQMFSKTDELA